MDDSWLCSFSNLVPALENVELQAASAADGGNIWGQFLVVAILLLVNGFFAASEMAVVSSNDNRIRNLAEEGNSAARLLTRYIEDSGNFLSTIQVGITFAGFLSSSVAGESFAGRLALLIQPGGPSDFVYSLSLVLVTLITSFMSIVFGEMIPKQIALSSPEKFALGVVRIIRFMEVVFKPITILITWTVNLFLKLFRVDVEANQALASEEEIRMLLDQGKRVGSIEDIESQMIVNIFEFDDKEVSEIMTHRTKVFALDIEWTLEEVIQEVLSSRYSRLPVYEDDIDNVVGVLHLKDLFSYLAVNHYNGKRETASDNFVFEEIIRDPYWVPESKRTNELLQEMQRDRVSVAVVIDEYGGTAGIVTIEDLLEEIVGNIQDEYDEEDFGITKVGKNTYRLSGMLSPEEVDKVLAQAYFPEEDDDDNDYDTIAGLILSVLGRIPDEDEQAEVSYKNMTLKVLSMDEKRIDQVEIKILKSLRQYLEDEKEREEEEKRQAEEERERKRKEFFAQKDDEENDEEDDFDYDEYLVEDIENEDIKD